MATIAIDARHIRSTTGRFIERQINLLAQIDSSHQYLLLMQPDDIERFAPPASNMRAVPAPFALYSAGEQTKMLQLLRGLQADLVHFCMPTQPTLYSGVTVTTFLDLTQLQPPLGESLTAAAKAKQAVARLVYLRAARRARLVLAISEYTRQQVIAFAGVAPERVRVTHLAADLPVSSSEPVPELVDKRFLLYVGRHTPEKNVDALMRAHQQLRTQYPELQLVIAGSLSPTRSGSAHRAREQSRARGDEGVIFTGFVTDERLRWLYETAAAFVFPSFAEGFGLPGLEAMASGAPVISSSATCLPEIYGQAALYFEPDRPETMKQQIARILDSTELRQELIARGHAQARRYSWERMAQETLDAYNAALGC